MSTLIFIIGVKEVSLVYKIHIFFEIGILFYCSDRNGVIKNPEYDSLYSGRFHFLGEIESFIYELKRIDLTFVNH